MANHIISKLFKNDDTQKTFKRARGKKTHYIQKNKNQDEMRPLIWIKQLRKQRTGFLKKEKKTGQLRILYTVKIPL